MLNTLHYRVNLIDDVILSKVMFSVYATLSTCEGRGLNKTLTKPHPVYLSKTLKSTNGLLYNGGTMIYIRNKVNDRYCNVYYIK